MNQQLTISPWVPPANGVRFRNAAEKHDRIADEYEQQYESAYWRLYDALTWAHMTEVFDGVVPGRLLDAGGGTGRWAREFAKRGFHVDVVDLAPGMIRRGQELAEVANLGQAISFHAGDVCNLPFADAEFDAVVCQGNPVSYCADPRRGLRELARVARPGASVVVSVHNRLAMAQYYCFLMGKISVGDAVGLIDTGSVVLDYPIYAFTPDDLRDACAVAGLTVRSLVGKPVLSGFAQTPAYLAALRSDEQMAEVVALERRLWREPSLLGLAGHLEVACIRR